MGFFSRIKLSRPFPATFKLKGVPVKTVTFLDGDEATVLVGAGKQFVNLPRAAKWVDGVHVKNIDRVGQKPRIRVEFEKPGAHQFNLSYEPGADNVVYSGAEVGRNANFKHRDTKKAGVTTAAGTCVVADMNLSAAGKDRFKAVAENADGDACKGTELEVHRLVYYQTIKMKDLPAASDLSVFEAEFARHNITLVCLGNAEMDAMPNISTGDSATYQTKTRTAYAASGASAKEPYVVAAGFTGHLAVKDASQVVVKAGVEVGPGKPVVRIPIVNGSGTAKYLWKNLVPGEGWFVSARFLRNGGVAGTDDVVIGAAQCTAVPINAANPDMCRAVKVDVTSLVAATGTITLTVNWVNRMRGGLSFGGGNLICVCTRAWWQDESEASQNQVLIHEMGHKVGMTPSGTGKEPDKTATFYDNTKGHVGPHCHSGLPAAQARFDGAGDNAASTCVMYGATNGKTAFCNVCTPAIRKQDLSTGWPAF